MNSSISHPRVALRAEPSGNRARPTVAAAIQGDHAPAAYAESSKRNPAGLEPSALSAGTSRWAGCRGRHSANVTSRSLPSDVTLGAVTTSRAHDGGTTRSSESGGHAENASNRSVGTRARSSRGVGCVGGVGGTSPPTTTPFFALRRPCCASRLAPGLDYCNSWAPLEAASRLRGAPLTGPVVSSPSTPPAFAWTHDGARQLIASPYFLSTPPVWRRQVLRCTTQHGFDHRARFAPRRRSPRTTVRRAAAGRARRARRRRAC